MYIQEHWLCTEQIGQLRDVSADFHVIGVSGFENKEVLRGRPYGGTAILWRKDMHVFIDNIETHSKRVCGLHMYCRTWIRLIWPDRCVCVRGTGTETPDCES